MKVLVTGSTGFIGRALCHHLRAQGHEVVATVRRQTSLAGAVVLLEDDEAGWQAALTGCDSVIHLAGRAHIMKETDSDPLAAFRQANVSLTFQLARRAAAAGVKRFVFVSTVKVNGESTAQGAAFLPQDEPRPQDDYALSKWEAEQGLKDIARETGLSPVIVRPPLVYGPGAKGNFATLIRWVGRGIPLPFGAVNNQRSLIALDNLVDFLVLCADQTRSPQASHEVFLVSDGSPVSTSEMLRKIGKAYGRSVWLLPVPVALMRLAARLLGQGAVADRLFGSLVIHDDKLSSVLGWVPPVSMDEQLQRMVDAPSS